MKKPNDQKVGSTGAPKRIIVEVDSFYVVGMAIVVISVLVFFYLLFRGSMGGDLWGEFLKFLTIIFTFFSIMFAVSVTVISINTFSTQKKIEHAHREVEDIKARMNSNLEETVSMLKAMPVFFAEILHANQDALSTDDLGRERAHQKYIQLSHWFEMRLGTDVDVENRLRHCREIIGVFENDGDGMPADGAGMHRELLLAALDELQKLSRDHPERNEEIEPLRTEAYTILAKLPKDVI